MKNIKKRLIGWTLGLALSLGVGIGIASNTHSEITGVEAAEAKLTITAKDFNSNSYADNNNEKTSTINGADYKWKSNQIMLQSNAMQWQKNNGTLENTTALGSGISSISMTFSGGTFSYATASSASALNSATYFNLTNGKLVSIDSNDTFFKIKVGGATGKSTKLEVTFAEKPSATLTGISVKSEPKKITYYAGEKFDPTGLVVTKTFDNAPSEDLPYAGNGDTNFKFNPGLDTPLQETNTFVEITVGGKTINLPITVKPARTLSGLAITSGLESVKKTYGEGSSFDPAGLVVTATYNDGSTEDVSSSVVWTPSTLSLTTTSVTGTYEGLTVTVDGIVVSLKNTFNIENNGKYTISHTKNGTVYYLKSNGTVDMPTTTEVVTDATVFVFTLVGNDTFEIKTADGDYLYSKGKQTDGLRVGPTEDTWHITKGTKTNGSYDLIDANSNRCLSLSDALEFRMYSGGNNTNRKENTDLNKFTLPFFKITGAPEGNIKIGDMGTLGIDDETLNVSWTSSDKSIVAIVDGMYSAEAGGVATITATHESGAKATVEIVVDFNTIKISEANTLAAKLGSKETSKYKVTIENAFVTEKTDSTMIVLSDNKVGSENLNSITLYDRTLLEDLSKNAILNGRVTVTGNLKNYSGTLEIVNPVFTYNDDAIEYADEFFKTFTVATGENSAICADPNKDNSAGIIEMWDTVAGLYDMLDEYAKAKLKGATFSDSNPTIANMVALYDHIVKRYSAAHTEINDFIGRGVTASLTNQLFKANTTNNIMVISLIACASAAAIGSFFFIRKRKEQN